MNYTFISYTSTFSPLPRRFLVLACNLAILRKLQFLAAFVILIIFHHCFHLPLIYLVPSFHWMWYMEVIVKIVSFWSFFINSRNFQVGAWGGGLLKILMPPLYGTLLATKSETVYCR